NELPDLNGLLEKAAVHGGTTNYARHILNEAQSFQNHQEHRSHSPSQRALIEPLTDRELEVLRLLANGHSNSEIATELFLAVGTVKKHINNIFGKLGVASRTQALLRAKEWDIL
ncbi:MAG TPA: response regulator transcription factor, partial [Bacillota bacterium]|nr:response regulator transcription factor [Bacillota bacterium]